MWHQWVNIAGLTFDFLGVILLSYEWWIALKADERESQIAEQEYFRESTMAMHRQNMPTADVLERMNKQMSFSSRQRRSAEARGMRRGYFVLAVVLIASGFVLQILGSLPFKLF